VSDFIMKMLSEHEVCGLVRFDGCCCGEFVLRGVHVEISCWRTGPRDVVGSSVHVFDRSDETPKDVLQAIGDEVARQVSDMWACDTTVFTEPQK